MLAQHLHAPTGRGTSFRRRLKCYPPAFLLHEKPDTAEALERGDKVILYSSYVSELEEALSTGMPLIFEVVNEKVGKTTHVGVLEFSGEHPGVAYLPAWVMHNLALEEGSEAVFRVRSLPKLTFLRLRPVSADFLEAFGGEPKGILEESLRSYTAVTEGDELVVHHADVAYGFKVLGIKPENASRAADLVGADCEVLFETAEDAVERVATPGLAGAGAVVPQQLGPRPLHTGETVVDELHGHNAVMYFTLLFKHVGHDVRLRLDSEPIVAEKPTAGTPVFGAAKAPEPPATVAKSPFLGATAAGVSMEFAARARSGSLSGALRSSTPANVPPPDVAHAEADLYVSAVVSKPSRRSYQWKSTSASKSKELVISAADRHFAKSNDQGTFAFYVAVSAYGGACKFTLTAEAAPATAATPDQIVGRATDAAALGPGHKQCDNCDAVLPATTYVMHVNFCRRNNWKCPECGAIVRIADRDKGGHQHCKEPGCNAVLQSPEDLAKHVDLEHNPYPCDLCGIPVIHELHEDHVQHHCEYRRVECVYCKLNVPYKDIHDHEAKCGGRTVPCDICGRLIPRKRLDRHKAVDHHLGDASAFGPETPMLTASPAMPTSNPDVLGGNLAALGLDDFALEGSAVPPVARPLVRHASDAVTCPACHQAMSSFEECQAHLVYNCAKRGTDEHRELVKNLVGEDAIAQIVPAESSDMATPPTLASSTPRGPSASGPRRTLKRWQCPMCKALFPNEDDCQIHALTACPTPWEDPSTASEHMKMVPVDESGLAIEEAGSDTSSTANKVPPVVADSDEEEAVLSPLPSASPEAAFRTGNSFAALADDGNDSDTSTEDMQLDDAAKDAAAMETPLPDPPAPAAETFRCPSCATVARDMEELQMHMLTECPHAEEHAAAMFS